MSTSGTEYDVVVVGAGPNGLAAAIVLAQAGLSTLVMEAATTPGGGCRSAALTLPGFVHDVCSTVHPLGVGSPFFRTLQLERYGLSWAESPACLAHVITDGTTVTLERSLAATAAQLGEDGPAYARLLEPFAANFERLSSMILGPLRLPASPFLLARFGMHALQSLSGLADRQFRGAAAPALLAGISAHAMLPLDWAATASFGLVLAAAGHAFGWPIAVGGSDSMTRALVACLREAGGELLLDHRVLRREQLPKARAYVFDVTPRQLLGILGDALPATYARRLERFRYGPGVYKMDWALSGPIPWKDARCARACTVHLSGTLAEVSEAQATVHAGRVADSPFTLLVQPSLWDASRAPPGFHTAWAYCHVPHNSNWDASSAIEAKIERFAPGFQDVVVGRATKNAVQMEDFNSNYVGGDINGGRSDLGQLFFRPVLRHDPYSTPLPNVFLCSSSTPPGGGVHGMCGYWSARSVLRSVFGYRAARASAVPKHASASSTRAPVPG